MPSYRCDLVLAANMIAAAAVLLVPSAGYAADIPAAPFLQYNLDFAVPTVALAAIPAADAAAGNAGYNDQAVECMAKVVHHESRGQPRKGQVAVARTLVNRLRAGSRFGGSICEVANQRGQYFNTSAYHPVRDSDWQTAVDVARHTLDGSAEDAAPGALFFHAAYRGSSGFFRGRQRVAAIGGQVFYR